MLGWEVIPRIGFGRFSVSPHGVAIALGYFAGTWLTARKAREKGINDDLVWNAAAVGVVGAVIGARSAYVLGHASDFGSPLEWFQIWRGGLSIVGSLIGGFTAGYLYTRRVKADFFQIADLGMPFLALGIAIGRMGDLAIGDHLGKQTSGWWGWRYKGGELISPPPCIYPTEDGCIRPGMVVHQTALYDAVWCLIIFGLLLLLARKARRRGFFFLTWASLYSAGRIATDFTRVDKRWLSGLLDPLIGQGLTGSQLTATVVLASCVFLLVKYGGVPSFPRATAAGGRESGGREGAAYVAEDVAPARDLDSTGDVLESTPDRVGELASRPAGSVTPDPQAPEPPRRPSSESPE